MIDPIPVPTLDEFIIAAKAGKMEAHIGPYPIKGEDWKESPWRPVEVYEGEYEYQPGVVQLTEEKLRGGRIEYRNWGEMKLVLRFRSGMLQPIRICE